jgi:NADH dehydrogenase [ubiquinone] 1 alpha subcomplex assembly factor 7
MSVEPAAAEKTALEERLIDLIKANGPITIADFMADALGHPHDGYYMSSSPIGASGDFTTAPEISQVFGELIGLWLVQSWTEMGQPKAFNLVELGPGRGVLMSDVLRASQLRPAFLRAAAVWLVETSGRLRYEQQMRLRAQSAKPQWADDFTEIAPAPYLIVANEFFDCLPIRQFERTNTGWRERLVGLSGDHASLSFVHASTPPPPDIDLPDPSHVELGTVIERSAPSVSAIRQIASALVEHGGRALIIDYGQLGTGKGDTLQAVRRHRYWPVLSSPGKADITAHVDFEALSRAAVEEGAACWGPVAQGAFLNRLGLPARVAALSAGKDEAEIEKIRSGVHRIAAPEEMGEVFKVMCVSSPTLPTPAGFETT